MNRTKRYRFISADNPPVGNQFDGLNTGNTLCTTDYQQGSFYMTHYLKDDSDKFARYARAAGDEIINKLERELAQLQSQTIGLRDLFAIAALSGELSANRGTTIEQAVNFSYAVADKMIRAREADDRKPTAVDRKATERIANKIINQMKGFDNGF